MFVTAYDEYAVAAFEQGAIDYVMKPFSPARLDDDRDAPQGRSSRARPPISMAS